MSDYLRGALQDIAKYSKAGMGRDMAKRLGKKLPDVYDPVAEHEETPEERLERKRAEYDEEGAGTSQFGKVDGSEPEGPGSQAAEEMTDEELKRALESL